VPNPLPETETLLPLLVRIAEALERLAPPAAGGVDTDAADAFVWHTGPDRLDPVRTVNRVDLVLLQGIARQREILLENTRRFAAGLPANNALLWGARGMGKSSLVKAVHAAVVTERPGSLALVEIAREDIPTLPRLLGHLRESARRFVLFCDDLSFDGGDSTYKSLKAVLEGGIEGRPGNVVFYATSNRRHLMPRDMIENERATAINPGEAVEEKVSLSDRFGLWLGFHVCDQDTFFAMIEGYAAAHGLDVPVERLRAEAVEWSVTRGGRSGRVAWQFVQDLAGRLGRTLGPGA
jgi:predicted AAA+ superfamily ATPase